MSYERWGKRRQAAAAAGFLAKGALLGAWVYGTWAYGTTRESSATAFAWILYASAAFWALERLFEWRRPAIPLFALAGSLLLIGLGWLVAGAGFLFDSDSDWLIDLPEFWANLVISLSPVDTALATQRMFRDTALLLMFLVLTDTLSDPWWRRVVFGTVAALGAFVAAFGLLQFAVGGPFQWMSEDGRIPLHFAVFRYHGNAGAFLNLTWPAVLTLAVVAARRAAGATWPRHLAAWGWGVAALVALGACFLNTSKAGNFLAGAGMVLFAALAWAEARGRRRLRSGQSENSARLLRWIAVVPVAIVLVSFAFLVPWHRWDSFVGGGVQNESRWHAYGLFLNVARDAGWTGFGPGNFQAIYSQYVPVGDPVARVPYWVAHQDYIQTVVEWGGLGAALWFLLLGGGCLGLVRKAFRREEPRDYEEPRIIDLEWRTLELSPDPGGPGERWMAVAGVTAVVLTGLHSAFDFPMQIMLIQALFLYWIALGYQRRVPAAAAD